MAEITRESIIEAAKHAEAEAAGPISRPDFERLTGISQYHIYRLFPEGGWSEVKRLGNLERHPKDNEPLTDDELLEEFHRVASEMGQIPTWSVSWSSFNQAVCGLRFLYEVTLQRPWEVRHIPFGKRPKKLPVVLSDEEASRLFQCMHKPKHRAVLLTCYAAGLRLREATHLRVADIDGNRQQIHVRAGKGSKERFVPASPRLLDELREYWKIKRFR